MAIEAVTGSLLGSVLASPAARNPFTLIVNKRIAEKGALPATSDSQAALAALESADLIGSARGGEKYFVTAKGLKVARDLDKLPIG
ncbi:MAG: hypothetical protein ACLP59_02970 [Bryobacteraceae bacterium]